MAQAQNITLPPNISIPQALELFMSGFDCKSEKEAKFIFEQAIKLIGCNSKLDNKDLQDGYNLFCQINPQDDIEKIWCAQFIVCHLLGTHSLTLASGRDKHIGLKLLKIANGAMERIQKKRNGTLSKSSHTEE